jgi:hypothetical protein
VLIELGKENYDQEWNARASRRYLSRIDYLPRDSVLSWAPERRSSISISECGARPDWQTIQPGSGWPDERLASVIDGHLAAGRPVFVDFDRNLWLVGNRPTRREEIGLEMIRRECQIELVHDDLYRILKHTPQSKSLRLE